MTALATVAARAALCGPVPDPIAVCFDDLARRSSALFRARLAGHDPVALRQAIVEARAAFGDAAARAAELAREFAPATPEQLDAELERLLHAFPDASPEDAAGYGAQLADDVIALRPSWRGLRIGCERVRLRHKFTRLPAIATVWDAIGTADRDVSAAAKLLGALPEYIARAEAALDARSRPAPRLASRSVPLPVDPEPDERAAAAERAERRRAVLLRSGLRPRAAAPVSEAATEVPLP